MKAFNDDKLFCIPNRNVISLRQATVYTAALFPEDCDYVLSCADCDTVEFLFEDQVVDCVRQHTMGWVPGLSVRRYTIPVPELFNRQPHSRLRICRSGIRIDQFDSDSSGIIYRWYGDCKMSPGQRRLHKKLGGLK